MVSSRASLFPLVLLGWAVACQAGASGTPAPSDAGPSTGGTTSAAGGASGDATASTGGTTSATGGAPADARPADAVATGGATTSTGGAFATGGAGPAATGGQMRGGSGGNGTGGATATAGTGTGGGSGTGGARDAGVDRQVAPEAGPEAGLDVPAPADALADAVADAQRTDAKTSTATFRNPLNPDHGSDPFMTYYQGNYYLAATTWGKNLTMKKGATIAALKAASPQVIWQDSTAARSGNMWAPEFYLLDNGAGEQRWYHYYTAGDGSNLDTQRSHVLESTGTDPMGPYRYKAQLLNYWAIDGSVLQAGGKLYFMFSAWQGSTQNVWIVAMTSPWSVTGERTLLSSPTYAWEKEGSDQVNEGPVALYHGGRTFVTYSASQCASPGYKLGMLELTGANPLTATSWRKNATAVFQGAGTAYGAGHNGFFVSPDGSEDWIVYHATTNASGSCWTDRTTRIQKFTWNADGTPNFGSPLATTTDIPVPSGE